MEYENSYVGSKQYSRDPQGTVFVAVEGPCIVGLLYGVRKG